MRSKVDLARNQLRSLHDLRSRIEDIRSHIRGYMERIRPLASKFDIEFDEDHPGTAPTAADMLAECT